VAISFARWPHMKPTKKAQRNVASIADPQPPKIEGGSMSREKRRSIWFRNEHEIAALLGMSVQFLRKDRRTKQLIPFFRIGDRVWYDERRVIETLASLEQGGDAKRPSRSARGVERQRSTLLTATA
jgi:hypothetical protein